MPINLMVKNNKFWSNRQAAGGGGVRRDWGQSGMTSIHRKKIRKKIQTSICRMIPCALTQIINIYIPIERAQKEKLLT